MNPLMSKLGDYMSTAVPVLFLYFIVFAIFFTYKYFTTKDGLKTWCGKKALKSYLCALGVIVIWVVFGIFNSMMGVGQGGSDPIPTMAVQSESFGGNSYSVNNSQYYNDQNNNGNVTDTRDFSKKSFSATLKTRAVDEVARQITKLIKSKDGRIDSSDISEESGYISFVIPKSNLDDFEGEIKTFVNKNLYSQRIISQNLLGEKKNLERNQEATSNTISSLESSKNSLKNQYVKASSELKATLTTQKTKQVNLLSSISQKQDTLNSETNQNIQSSILSELETLRQAQTLNSSEMKVNEAKLTDLTSNYTRELTALGVSQEQQQKELSNLGVQTNNLLDNVETVQGTVNIQKISYLELFDAFSPITSGWIVVILIGIFMLSNMYHSFKAVKEISILQKEQREEEK